MNHVLTPIGSLLLLVLFASTIWAQDANTRKVTGVINGEEVVGPMPGIKATVLMTDQRMKLLRQQGGLQISVPSGIGNLQSVVLKRPTYFKEASARAFAQSMLHGQSMVMDVSESVLDRIDYQPVELKVYESGFSSVVLKYTGGLSASRKATEQIGDPKVDSPVVTLKFNGGRSIMGRIRGLKSIAVNSSIGKLNLELEKLSRIEMGKKGNLTIEMPSGNRISGTISVNGIVLLNRWENETFQLGEISEIIIEKTAVFVAKPPRGTVTSPSVIAK